jgi:hypothetical protein
MFCVTEYSYICDPFLDYSFHVVHPFPVYIRKQYHITESFLLQVLSNIAKFSFAAFFNAIFAKTKQDFVS